MKPLHYLIIGFVIGVIAFFLLTKLFSCNGSAPPGVEIIRDTNTVVRYEWGVKTDTVIKWYERIIYKENEPKTIYIQKTDTVFATKVQDMDVVLKLQKKGKVAKVTAYNQNGKYLKELIFDNVGENFTVISQPNDIFVKSQIWYWNKPSFNLELINSIDSTIKGKFAGMELRPSIETGISFKNIIDLGVGIEYLSRSKDYNAKLKLTVKPF